MPTKTVTKPAAKKIAKAARTPTPEELAEFRAMKQDRNRSEKHHLGVLHDYLCHCSTGTNSECGLQDLGALAEGLLALVEKAQREVGTLYAEIVAHAAACGITESPHY